jgi:hypothetical protein
MKSLPVLFKISSIKKHNLERTFCYRLHYEEVKEKDGVKEEDEEDLV